MTAIMRLFAGCITAILILQDVLGDDDFQCHDLYQYNVTENKVVDVYSPFYLEKGKYPNRLWCESRITGPVGNRLKVTFKDLDLEPSSYCSNDQLVIYANEKEYVLQTLCGSDIPEPIITHYGMNTIHLLFRTDHMVAGRGYHFQVETARDFERCPGKKACENLKCYSEAQKCNGEDDCGDGSDEEGCDLPLPTTECGKPSIVPDTVFGGRRDQSPDRIIGGQEAIPGSWPWQISLQYKYSTFSHTCGGSLINAQWVVTAAHCFKGNPVADSWRVHIGKHHKYHRDSYEQVRYVERLIIWPDLTGDNIQGVLDMNNDIALLKLNSPVKFTKHVQPICLPSFGWNIPPGTTCYATGWGETRGTGSDDALKQVDVAVMSKDNCSYSETSQICVKNKKGFQSTCHGDSGGPLVTMLGDRWYLMGGDSFGTLSNFMHGLCAMPEQRTVFMKVSDKAEWIRKMVDMYS